MKKYDNKEDKKEIKEKKKEKKKQEKEEKKKLKQEKKGKKDYTGLKKKAKIVMIVCLIIIVIELVMMFFMKERRESALSFIDTFYNVKSVDDEYYLAVGSSNFKHSHYNDAFTFEYQDGIKTDQINKVYAEQAKLVKYDKELNVVFEKTFKTDYDSTFYDVAKVKDGIIAVGSYVHDKEQLSINTRDGLVVKYDLDGKELWHKNFQVLGDTEFKSILIEDDGFVVVGQSIYENMEIGNHNTGGGIIVKYDFDGKELWRGNFGGNKSGIFEDIVKVQDGYIVCGKDALNYGLIVKFSLDGKFEWKKNYEFTDNYGMYDIKIKDDKLYIATAINVSDEHDEDGNLIYNYDAGILVYDLNGELLDKYTIGGSLDDRFNSLLLLDDKIVAVGYTRSKDIKIKDLKYKENMSEGIIVEFDYTGKVLSSKIYGGDKNDILNEIIFAIPETADKINNTKPYIVVGYTNSKHGLFNGNNKDYYAKILKYDDKLELISEK